MDRLRLRATWVALAIASSTCEGCQGQSDPAPMPPSPDLAMNPGCPTNAEKKQSVSPELGMTVENFPRVDGSTSAQPLLMMMACKILGAGYEWVHTEQDDSRKLY